jgi:hypothetical protein
VTFARALDYADFAVRALVDAQRDGGETGGLLGDADGDDAALRFEVYQAQGMLLELGPPPFTPGSFAGSRLRSRPSFP